MKKYLENTTCRTPLRITKKIVINLLILAGLTVQAQAQAQAPIKNRFTPLDRTIIQGVLSQFKKECSYVSTTNDAKLIEIQTLFRQSLKDFSKDQVECFEQYIGQIVGAQNIYKGICDELTVEKISVPDSDLSRQFINIRKFENGIRPFHEKLNDCLVRRGVESEYIVEYSDFEKNSKILSQKIREADTQPPFRENRVDFR